MRWVHLTIVCLLGLATLIFAFENMEIVGIDFIWLNIRMPLAFLVIVIYIVGMVTGSTLQSFVRWSVQGARLRS